MLSDPVVAWLPAKLPTAMLELPVLPVSADTPIAVLLFPLTFIMSACAPTAVFRPPSVVVVAANLPTAVLDAFGLFGIGKGAIPDRGVRHRAVVVIAASDSRRRPRPREGHGERHVAGRTAAAQAIAGRDRRNVAATGRYRTRDGPVLVHFAHELARRARRGDAPLNLAEHDVRGPDRAVEDARAVHGARRDLRGRDGPIRNSRRNRSGRQPGRTDGLKTSTPLLPASSCQEPPGCSDRARHPRAAALRLAR